LAARELFRGTEREVAHDNIDVSGSKSEELLELDISPRRTYGERCETAKLIYIL